MGERGSPFSASSIRERRWVVAALAIRSTGWLTEVNRGLVVSQNGEESNPTTETSSGTRTS